MGYKPLPPDYPWHNASTYTNHGCRCTDCTEGHRQQVAKARTSRRVRLIEDPTLVTHGRASTYQNWGCRCDACTAANTEDQRRYRKSKQIQSD